MEKLHRDCEQHTTENCDINTHSNLDPVADDCGHRVEAGPGTLNTGQESKNK